MAIKNRSNVAAMPAKPRAERGPSLVWNPARDAALVGSLYDGKRRRTNAEVATVLASHETFASVPQGAVTPAKVGLRLGKLRKANVPIPRATRTRTQVDADALTSLLPASVVKAAAATEASE